MDEWTKSFLVSIIVDAIEYSIQRLCKVLQQIFYSGKTKQHILKYEIGLFGLEMELLVQHMI